jgi:hypothetical protein
MANDDRILSPPPRAKDICPQDIAVVHFNRHVPVDPHPVPNLGAKLRIIRIKLGHYLSCLGYLAGMTGSSK